MYAAQLAMSTITNSMNSCIAMYVHTYAAGAGFRLRSGLSFQAFRKGNMYLYECTAAVSKAIDTYSTLTLFANMPPSRSNPTGEVVVDHVELGSGGFTGLAVEDDDPRTGLPILYASTITGGLYAFRLEAARATGGAGRAEAWRLRCLGFVRGTAIS